MTTQDNTDDLFTILPMKRPGRIMDKGLAADADSMRETAKRMRDEAINEAMFPNLLPWQKLVADAAFALRQHAARLALLECEARRAIVPAGDSATSNPRPGATVFSDEQLDAARYGTLFGHSGVGVDLTQFPDDPIDADEGPRKPRKLSYKQLQRLSPAERAEYARERGKREGA